MKNILKKNQVIITALAIMIVVAGYLQFTKDKANDAQQSAKQAEETMDTASNDVLSIDEATSELLKDDVATVDGTTDISDEDNATVADAQGGTDVVDIADAQDSDTTDVATADTEDGTDVAAADATTTDAATTDDQNAGEAVLVNTTISADFFSTAKLQREQTRAKNKETLMSIVDNKNLTEAEKQDALDKVIEMTTITEKENAAETWLEAKGFDGAVVTIIDGHVDVIVGVHSATDQTMAQIEDIVKNKTGVTADKITINPVIVKDAE